MTLIISQILLRPQLSKTSPASSFVLLWVTHKTVKKCLCPHSECFQAGLFMSSIVLTYCKSHSHDSAVCTTLFECPLSHCCRRWVTMVNIHGLPRVAPHGVIRHTLHSPYKSSKYILVFIQSCYKNILLYYFIFDWDMKGLFGLFMVALLALTSANGKIIYT